MPAVALGAIAMMYRRGDTLAIAILLSLLDGFNALICLGFPASGDDVVFLYFFGCDTKKPSAHGDAEGLPVLRPAPL
jgi:hypothetical protein